jgi:putative redox protein
VNYFETWSTNGTFSHYKRSLITGFSAKSLVFTTSDTQNWNMNTKIQWRNNVHFSATSDSGHEVLMDGPPDSGGENRGSRPMELMLMGLGGCTSFDVINILKKSRQQVTNCVTEITAQRADTIPQVFEDINIHFLIEGDGLDTAKVERAIRLTAEKYCSASIMLQRAGVNITHSFDITQTGA